MSGQHPLSWYADCIRNGDDPLVVLEYVSRLSHAGGERSERERILRIIRSDVGAVLRSPHATDYLPQFLDREHLVAAVVQEKLETAS